MSHVSVEKLQVVETVLKKTLDTLRVLIAESEEYTGGNLEGYARVSDVAEFLGVSNTSARKWMRDNGATRSEDYGKKARWQMPWAKVYLLLSDPSIRRPKARGSEVTEAIVKAMGESGRGRHERA